MLKRPGIPDIRNAFLRVTRDHHAETSKIVEPGSLQLDAIDLLESGGYDASMANIERLKPLLIQARKEAIEDVEHARAGEYKKIADLSSMPPRTTPALDFIKAFEEYADKGGLKGGKFGPTAKRWRPKVKAFCDFLEDRDLKRMTTADGYKWMDVCWLWRIIDQVRL